MGTTSFWTLPPPLAGLLIMYSNSLFFISRIKTIIIYVLDFKLADFLNVFFGKLFDKSLH